MKADRYPKGVHNVAFLAISMGFMFTLWSANAATWEDAMAQEHAVWGLYAQTLQGFAITTQPLSRLEGATFVLKNFPASVWTN